MPERPPPILVIPRGDPDYPARLTDRLGEEAPEALALMGAAGLLQLPMQALLCSIRIPPDLVLSTYDLARTLRDAGAAVVSGFHAPLERECLDFLLAGQQPVIVCPARGLEGLRLRPAWRAALEEGRLLVLSRQVARRRPTGAMAEARNRLVAALAERVFVAHATPGGRLHRLATQVAARSQPLACFEHRCNDDLLVLGARALPARLRSW